MKQLYYFLRKKVSKVPENLYLGFETKNGQLVYPTGIKILPAQFDFKKKCVKKVAFLEVNISKPVPFLSTDTLISFDSIEVVLQTLKTEVNNFASLNNDNLTKEVLKSFLDDLYSFTDNELGKFATDLNNFVKRSINQSKVKKLQLSKADLIELTEKFLNSHKPTKSFFDYFNTYINEIENGTRVKDGAILNYRTIQRNKTTRDLLLDFEKENKKQITFESIDKKFETDFNSYMAKVKDYAPATMGKHITTLKAVLKEALEEGIHTNIKFQSFKALETESNSIALNPTEIDLLYKLDLKENKRLETVRDMFVLGCHSGLRWSDYTDIKPENIKQGTNGLIIDIIQEKTKNQVVIPVNNIILEILTKYNHQLPKPISNQKFNDYLKEVAKMVDSLHNTETMVITKGGKTKEVTKARHELISSHTARRSFATNAFEKGIETKLIRAISGHRTDVSFYSYIKTDATKQAEMFREKNI